IKPIFSVTFHSEIKNNNTGTIELQVSSNFPNGLVARNVEVHIPVPSDCYSPRFSKLKIGSMRYAPEHCECVWSIPVFHGETNANIRLDMQLPSVHSSTYEDMNRPVSFKFQVRLYAFSGIRIKRVNCNQQTSYKFIAAVYYETCGGNYE
ncbi:hypothetical protein A3Q56_07451, partial [Intoshia linei]